jgi:hypothetical protein
MTAMSDEQAKKPEHLKLVPEEELDEEEQEFRAIRRDLPGAKGASAVGLVTIGVSKTPGKNEFFRTHPDFRPVVPMVDCEVGMEKRYFPVTDPMIEALASIGISVSLHTLYLTTTARGAVRIVPVRCPDSEGNQNEYHRTMEVGLLAGRTKWVRIYVDKENRSYMVFEAPQDRFADPVWPGIKPAKIFRLAFKDKGWLIDSTEHPLFLQWAARDKG